ncbi:hypothetical protein BFL35_01505 [Clavibacter michiganensis]|nr:hypothetical protein BFL35_01505 [Clavibacter michiganensis]
MCGVLAGVSVGIDIDIDIGIGVRLEVGLGDDVDIARLRLVPRTRLPAGRDLGLGRIGRRDDVVHDAGVLVELVVVQGRQQHVVHGRDLGRDLLGRLLDQLGVDHGSVRDRVGQAHVVVHAVGGLQHQLGGRVVHGLGIPLDLVRQHLAREHLARRVVRGRRHVPGVGLAGELDVARVHRRRRDLGLGGGRVGGVRGVGGIRLVERGDAVLVLGRVERDDARQDVAAGGRRRVGGRGIHALLLGRVVLAVGGHDVAVRGAAPADRRERTRGALAVGVRRGSDRERVVVVATGSGSAAGRLPAHYASPRSSRPIAYR